MNDEQLAQEAPPAMRFGQIPGLRQPVSRLIMGTMIFTPDAPERTDELLDHFVSLGGNALDTARVYGGGRSELAVGEWLARRGNRERLVLIGKGAHHDAQGPRVTPEAIDQDLVASLQALGTRSIDLYLLHRDDPACPVGPLVECLNEHQQAGRVHAFGASNWQPARIEEANRYAAARGLAGFVASSPNFSLAVPNGPPWPGCVSASMEGREWYLARQFPLLAWSSQAQGFFTGRYAEDDRSDSEMVRVWYSEANFARLRRAREVAARRGVNANTIALAYVLCQPFPTFALIGPRTTAETADSARALAVELSEEERKWVESGV